MYVCVCNKVTDRQIRKAAKKGCRGLDDLRRELGVATCCGCCAEMAGDILEESFGLPADTTGALPQPA